MAYRVINDVAITLADPISPPEHDEASIDGFTAFCDENGWTPVFYSVHPRVMPVFEAGLAEHARRRGDDPRSVAVRARRQAVAEGAPGARIAA